MQVFRPPINRSRQLDCHTAGAPPARTRSAHSHAHVLKKGSLTDPSASNKPSQCDSSCLAWPALNGFRSSKSHCPKIGSRVLSGWLEMMVVPFRRVGKVLRIHLHSRTLTFTKGPRGEEALPNHLVDQRKASARAHCLVTSLLEIPQGSLVRKATSYSHSVLCGQAC